MSRLSRLLHGLASRGRSPIRAMAGDLSTDFLPRYRGGASPDSRLPQSELEAIFRDHRGRPSRKWQHYFRIYEEELTAFRARDTKLLELGVLNGGSLQIWRKYLGANATIMGVDIDPNCAALHTPDLPVKIGSQSDPEFLRGVVTAMGGLDVVVDDASHLGPDQIASFKTLFPLLAADGLYLIEDLHAAYWRDYGGGVECPGTTISFVKDLIDDLHGWYHRGDAKALSSARSEIGRIAIYDSIVAIRKCSREPPLEAFAGLWDEK